MILPPPHLFPVSTAFLKCVLIDFNLAETRSFVIKSKSLLRGNVSSQDIVHRTSTSSVHTLCVLISSDSFIITFCFEIEAYFKEKLNFIIRPIKIKMPSHFSFCLLNSPLLLLCFTKINQTKHSQKSYLLPSGLSHSFIPLSDTQACIFDKSIHGGGP